MRSALPVCRLRSALAIAAVAPSVAMIALPAAADEPLDRLEIEADRVETNLRLDDLDLRGHVRVRHGRLLLSADRLHLLREPTAAPSQSPRFHVEGDLRLAPCPCPDPPLTLGVSAATVSAPDDLVLKNATLRLFGVPVLWTPWLWLRSTRSVGVLLPELSFNTEDGLFVGDGLHFPLGRRLDVTAGAYTSGAWALGVDGGTARSRMRIRLERKGDAQAGELDASSPHGLGLSLDAQGVVGGEQGSRSPTLSWDVDAMRGPRWRRMSTELETLARPWDYALASASLGPARIGAVAWAPRGGVLDRVTTWSATTGLSTSGALGSLGGWDARIDGGPRVTAGRSADTLVDAHFAAKAAHAIGPLVLEIDLDLDGRAGRRGDLADVRDASPIDATRATGHAWASVFEPHASISLPLVRASSSSAQGSRAVLEPRVDVGAVLARGEGDDAVLDGFPLAPALRDGASGMLAAQIPTDLRHASIASIGASLRLASLSGPAWLIADGRAGVLERQSGTSAIVATALHWNAVDDARWQARFDLDAALVHPLGHAGLLDVGSLGALVLARGELSAAGFRLGARLAMRNDVDTPAALAMFGNTLAPRLVAPTGLSWSGTTLGGGIKVPLGRTVTIGGDLDVSLPEATLLDAFASARWAHPCGCLALGLRGGRVLGRGGLDVMGTIEIAGAGGDAEAGRTASNRR